MMMFLLVSKFKMIGMLLNVVNGQVQKSKQNHITKESNAFHNHSTLITMCRDHKCPVLATRSLLSFFILSFTLLRGVEVWKSLTQ